MNRDHRPRKEWAKSPDLLIPSSRVCIERRQKGQAEARDRGALHRNLLDIGTHFQVSYALPCSQRNGKRSPIDLSLFCVSFTGSTSLSFFSRLSSEEISHGRSKRTWSIVDAIKLELRMERGTL